MIILLEPFLDRWIIRAFFGLPIKIFLLHGKGKLENITFPMGRIINRSKKGGEGDGEGAELIIWESSELIKFPTFCPHTWVVNFCAGCYLVA